MPAPDNVPHEVALIKKRCRALAKVKKHRIDELKAVAIYAGRFIGNSGVDKKFCVDELYEACRHNGTARIETDALISKTINEGLAEGAKQHINGNGKVVVTDKTTPVVWREKRGTGPVASFQERQIRHSGNGCYDPPRYVSRRNHHRTQRRCHHTRHSPAHG